MSPSIRRRILLQSIYLTLILIGIRVLYWQLTPLSPQPLSSNLITPSRGQILFSDLSPAATNTSAYQISIYKPDLKSEPAEVSNYIRQYLPSYQDQYLPQLSSFFANPQSKWLTLIPPANTSLPPPFAGIRFELIDQRFHPEKDLALPILGQNVYQNSQLTGISGLESYYNFELTGEYGFFQSKVDALGQPILTAETNLRPPQNGANLVISLNRSFQSVIEKQIQESLFQYQADAAIATLIHSDTGQILAMAQTGHQSPNNYLFEPGSIFKPIVIAIGLDSRQIDTNYHCQICHQTRKISGFEIRNHDEKLHPNSNLVDTLKNSDNISMTNIADKITKSVFIRYFHQLNLDQKTKIDLLGESQPQSSTYWPPLDLAAASFGQAFAVTQLQFLSAFNSLASGQFRFPVLTRYFLKNSRTVPIDHPQDYPVFSTQTTDTVRQLLKQATLDSSIIQFNTQNLDICGKSGTAQVAIPGGYSQDQFISSYVGLYPCKKPVISLIVTIINPRSSPWGSSTAAPVWFKIVNQLYPLLNSL